MRYDRTGVRVMVLATAAVLSQAVGCGSAQDTTEEATPAAIDQRSYTLGAIAAFAEMVAAGVKQLALSTPLEPDAMDGIMDDARRIAAENGVELYRETDFMVTDLFSSELTEGKDVLLIYRGVTLEEYLALKREKARLIEAGAYEGAAREGVARRFGKMLSYSDEKIAELLAEHHSAGRSATDRR